MIFFKAQKSTNEVRIKKIQGSHIKFFKSERPLSRRKISTTKPPYPSLQSQHRPNAFKLL